MSIKTVLVTGARSPSSLHLCRLLKEAGHIVYAADSDPYSLTKVSNSIKQFILLPSVKFAVNSYISILNDVILTFNIDIIIPTCEETFYLSKREKELHCPVFAGSFDSLSVLHNKYDFIQLADSIKCSVPKTSELTKETAAEYSHLSNGFVVKRKFSRFSDHVLFGKDAEDIPQELLDEPAAWIIQEKLNGNQYCSYSIAVEGNVLVHCVYKSEYTAGRGAAISFQHEPRKDIEEFVEGIVKTLKYSGQISFDFIVNENNEAIPIECNPRTTSGIHLFGKELAEHMQSHHNKVLYPKKKTKYAIKAAMLLYAYFNIRKTKNNRLWINEMLSSRDIVFHSRDLKPYFYQFISLLNIWRQSRKNHVSMLTQSTYDMCWDGEEF